MKKLSCLAMLAVVATGSLSAVLGAGCGDDVNDADPMIFPEGGLGSGKIKGKVNVYVIDGKTNAPLTGASVYVGALTGTTDATGLFTFEDGSLSGAQTISAAASGYSAATWFGANGANVTIPLDPTSATAVDTAHAAGGIEGWDTLPAPAMGHYTLALVLYSQTTTLGADENNIVQGNTGGFPNNACINAPPLNQCAWSLNTRTGPQTHYAIIVDGDANGTLTDFSDDSYTLITYAVKTGIDLDKDQMVSGEMLTQLTAGDLQQATFTLPAAPTGLDELAAIPAVKMGDELILFPVPTVTPQNTTATVPKLAGDFASGSYLVYGTAKPMMMATPSTSTISRNANLGATFALPAWLPTATGLTAADRTFAFTPAAGATVHTAEFSTASGTKAWGVIMLDGSTSFTLPTLVGVADPLPVGMVTYKVSAIDIPNFDLENFSLENVGDELSRVSDTSIDFTH